MLYECYCIGCHDDSVIGRIHKQFGRVDCCAAHDPARFGQARDLLYPAVTAQAGDDPEAADVPALSHDELIAALFKELLRQARGGPDRPDGGKHARLQPPPKSLPPSGAAVRLH